MHRVTKRVRNHRISVNRLSPEALDGVIREFISGCGTDYGEIEVSWDEKYNRKKSGLERGPAVLLYDDETETTAIVSVHDPIMKKLGLVTE